MSDDKNVTVSTKLDGKLVSAGHAYKVDCCTYTREGKNVTVNMKIVIPSVDEFKRSHAKISKIMSAPTPSPTPSSNPFNIGDIVTPKIDLAIAPAGRHLKIDSVHNGLRRKQSQKL